MKYAIKDENGKIVMKEISDRKKCLTKAEWQQILNETQMKNHAYRNGLDYKYENGKRVNYFWVKFNHYAGFPLTVAEIHSHFGRGIDVIVNDIGYPNCELIMRAYRKWK